MRGERLSLKKIALASMIFAIPCGVSAQENYIPPENSVLNTVYGLISGEDRGIGLRKCFKFKSPMGNLYDLCAIAQEANIDGKNVQFFAANPMGLKREMKERGGSTKDVRTLEIAIIPSDKDCLYGFHYVFGENDSFNDSIPPYETYLPLTRDENGRFTNKVGEECNQKLMKDGLLDSNKMKQLREKFLDYISSIIKFNQSLKVGLNQ
jgi:hypothetical protein|tara:strand:- start:3470 stop:4093 length:624 start_codon:yes stop_codon:yes gene_type:complete